MALERSLEGRDQLLKFVKRHAREIQKLHRTGLQLGEPYTCHGSCLLSLYCDVRGASYQKESGINSNVFVLRGRPDDTTNEVGAAADLSTRFFSVHLEQSYRHFNDHGLVSLPAPGLRGLRTDTPFTTMQLDKFQEGRDQTVDTWVTRLRLRETPMPQWDMTQGYVFAHSTGTAKLSTAEGGVG